MVVHHIEWVEIAPKPANNHLVRAFHLPHRVYPLRVFTVRTRKFVQTSSRCICACTLATAATHLALVLADVHPFMLVVPPKYFSRLPQALHTLFHRVHQYMYYQGQHQNCSKSCCAADEAFSLSSAITAITQSRMKRNSFSTCGPTPRLRKTEQTGRSRTQSKVRDRYRLPINRF